jgi:hypothetical protein
MTAPSRRSQVLAELKEMKRVGMRVPPQAFEQLAQADLDEYDNMSASEIADLMIELA